jgi:Ca2+-binding RTX toxin-like protein
VVYTTTSYALNDANEVEGLSTLDWNGTAAINLTGNSLANYIIGNDGANVLNGGAGADVLIGRGGADTFAFTDTLGGGNVDTVSDFVGGTDKIALDDAIFGGIGAPGSFNANAFVVGTQAADADDRIIYDQATGQLFYDADGNGAGAAVLFATLDSHPVLTASDFSVI